MPYPIRGFSRTPLMLVRSRILTATGSAAESAPENADAKMSNRTSARRRPAAKADFICIEMRLLKIQNAQDGAQHRMRRPHPVRDHAFALDLQFEIADGVRSDRVVRSDIARAHDAAQHNGLLLVVHVDDALGLDHQVAARQNGDHSTRQRCGQARSRRYWPLPDKVSAECSPSRLWAAPTPMTGTESMPELMLKVRAVPTAPAFDEVTPWTTTTVIRSPVVIAL